MKYKIEELLCNAHSGDDYQEDFGKKCPICILNKTLSNVYNLNAKLNILCACLNPDRNAHFIEPSKLAMELSIECYRIVQDIMCLTVENTAAGESDEDNRN